MKIMRMAGVALFMALFVVLALFTTGAFAQSAHVNRADKSVTVQKATTVHTTAVRPFLGFRATRFAGFRARRVGFVGARRVGFVGVRRVGFRRWGGYYGWRHYRHWGHVYHRGNWGNWRGFHHFAVSAFSFAGCGGCFSSCFFENCGSGWW